MPFGPFVLAIDQGTTSTRALVVDARGSQVGFAQRELRQFFPGDGLVEHDPEDIWTDALAVMRSALTAAKVPAAKVAAIGIANQRETTLLWDRTTGEPIHNALVWQDRRTAPECRRLIDDGIEPLVRERTGLLIDPYFSATKIAWLLDHVPRARARAEAGELAFGTVDSFLLWRMTGGVHATDATNASRTLLFNIHTQDWDQELLTLFRIPAAILPRVRDNTGLFGTARSELFGASIPITGMAGDQQAGLVGQACLLPGMVKATFGTGAFIMRNTGAEPITSRHRLLTTIAYQLQNRPTYALEGSIFTAGAALQWLRDGLRIIGDAPSSEHIVRDLPDDAGVYLVPAFTGLGAPHWDPNARGLITGITRDTTAAHLVRAALESVAYQVRDLMIAMDADAGWAQMALRVDGGMAGNGWLCQFLADILDGAIDRPHLTETTALGAAFLAGLEAGVYGSMKAIANAWRSERRFEPEMRQEVRERLCAGWSAALARTLTSPTGP